jgi:hypothetical protein
MLGGQVGIVLCALTISSGVFAQQTATSPSTAALPSELGSMLDSQKEIFEKAHLTPIIIPQGEHVGDIIDVSNATLIATADDCFPGLNPRKESSVLPQRVILSEKGLGAALGVADIGNASGQIEGGHTFVLDFKDVRVERVSQYQLRTSLKKEDISECDKVKPFMTEDQSVTPKTSDPNRVSVMPDPGAMRTIVSQRPPPLLIGEVFYASRIVHVQTTQKITANAQLSLGEKILRTLGILSSFKVSATGDQNMSDSFDLVGQQSIPVALARHSSLLHPSNWRTDAQNIAWPAWILI